MDPFFTRTQLRRLWFGRVATDDRLVAELAPPCDFILISHPHWDHVMDAPAVARLTGATVLGSSNTCTLLSVCGVPDRQIREIAEGDELSLGSLSVNVLAAQHGPVPPVGFSSGPISAGLRPPLRLRDYRMDRCFSLLIHLPGDRRALHWQSELPQGAPSADVLFVAAHHSCEFYDALLAAVRPEMVVPIHWDELFRPLTQPVRPMLRPRQSLIPSMERVNLAAFERTIALISPGTKVLIPELCRQYDLDRPTEGHAAKMQ